MKIKITYLLLLWVFNSTAQNLNYSLYSAKGNWSCDKVKDTFQLRQTAASYFHQGMYAQALPVFECMTSNAMKLSKEELYQYALVTQSDGEANKALSLFNQFESRYPKDSRALLRKKSYLFNVSYDIVSCQLWKYNTPYSDYGVRFLDKQIVWCSNQPILSGRQLDLWQGMPYSNLFTFETNGDTATIKPMHQINGNFHEATSCLSRDGQTLYYTKNKAIKSMGKSAILGLEIRIAKRVDGDWKDVGPLLIQGFEEVDFAHPTLSTDGSKLYFVANALGGYGQSDIWWIDLTNSIPFQAINAGERINSAGRESFPFVSQEGILFFASDGHPGFGGLDIYAAKEAQLDAEIEHFQAPLNSKFDDFSIAIDASGKKAYLSSNRSGGKGSDDIYELLLVSKTEKKELILEVTQESNPKVTEELTQAVTHEVTREVNKENSQERLELRKTTNETTSIEEAIDKPNNLYELPVLYFELNSAELTLQSKQALEDLSVYLNAHTELRLQINAYADCRGSASYNLTLSQNRANACLVFFNSLLINKKQIVAKGFGEQHLVNDCNCLDPQKNCSEAEHAKNRRIEFQWK